MPTADRFAPGEPPAGGRAGTPEPKPDRDNLERALADAAEAGARNYEGGDEISADDAGGSKLAQELNRERAMPTGNPPDEGKA